LQRLSRKQSVRRRVLAHGGGSITLEESRTIQKSRGKGKELISHSDKRRYQFQKDQEEAAVKCIAKTQKSLLQGRGIGLVRGRNLTEGHRARKRQRWGTDLTDFERAIAGKKKEEDSVGQKYLTPKRIDEGEKAGSNIT